MESSGFYRVLQVGAVIGREVALGIATGGAGTLVGLGARAAGRVALGLVSRVAGSTAAAGVRAAAGRLACRVVTGQRLLQLYNAYQQIDTITANMELAQQAMRRGDYEEAGRLMGRSAAMLPGTLGSLRETMRFANAGRTLNPQNLRDYLRACFAAGTPILWEHGSKPVEELQPGDRVWARDENNPNGAVELKDIEEVFVNFAAICHLHVGGEVIRTTDEHPFWVVGKGWTKAAELVSVVKCKTLIVSRFFAQKLHRRL